MTDDLLILDLIETEIRGTDTSPIIVSRPRWTSVETVYPKFTASNYFGKRRSTYPFHSDDIKTTIKILMENGSDSDVAKALATNVIWTPQLIKHCTKLIARNEKASKKKTARKKTTHKKVSKPRTAKEIRTELTDRFKTDLNKNVSIKLDNWK